MGTGRTEREGLVAAKQRGDKAGERPVKILTKQKRSGVISAFKKNR